MRVQKRINLLTRLGIKIIANPRLRAHYKGAIYEFDNKEATEVVGRPLSRRFGLDSPMFGALVAELGDEGLARELVGPPNEEGKVIIRYNKHVILSPQRMYLYSFDLPSVIYRQNES